ncbi:MAG: hypothetical protein KBG48_32380 [Kofleriaceae bacterium]|nr:hypothetical protein [Kofleriaceae bacterium]MBP9172133.1 hypothetical protein [Kofleriaceae bacterium]MBP9858551.1 hypothetical protein [Kofleriaceae bacterium]
MAHRPSLILSIPLLALAAACADPAPPSTATHEAALQAPAPRVWDGTLTPSPTGKATLVFYADLYQADRLHAWFVDANTLAVYDHLKLKRDELGAVVANALLIDPDLAVAGSTVQPVPVGGGKGPRPGTEEFYVREMARGLPELQRESMALAELGAP